MKSAESSGGGFLAQHGYRTGAADWDSIALTTWLSVSPNPEMNGVEKVEGRYSMQGMGDMGGQRRESSSWGRLQRIGDKGSQPGERLHLSCLGHNPNVVIEILSCREEVTIAFATLLVTPSFVKNQVSFFLLRELGCRRSNADGETHVYRPLAM